MSDFIITHGPTLGTLFGSMASGAMLALGVTMMLVILLRRSGKYYRKLKWQSRKAGNPAARQAPAKDQMAKMFDRASPLLDAPATVVRWQVEMQELARELKAEIDTKMCLLQVLTQRSNEAAERLEAAAARAQRLGCVERQEPETPDSAGSTLAQAAAARPSTPPLGVAPYCDQVYAMSDSGENVADIADHIGLPVGDVEFALSLRSQAGESA